MATTYSRIIKRRTGTRKGDSKPNLVILSALSLIPLLAVLYLPIPLISQFEEITYDIRMRLRSQVDPRPIDDVVTLIGITDRDTQIYDQDLYSRSIYTKLINELRREGASQVAMDLFFVRELENDPILSSVMRSGDMPVTLAYHFQDSIFKVKPSSDCPDDLASFLEYVNAPEDHPTEVFGSAVLDLDVYMSQLEEFYTTLDLSGGSEDPELIDQTENTLTWVRYLRDQILDICFQKSIGRRFPELDKLDIHQAKNIRMLSPSLMLAADSMGFTNVEKGDKDIVRSVPLLYEYKGNYFPHFSLSIVLKHFGLSFDDVLLTKNGDIEFTPSGTTTPIRIPIDDRGHYLVNFREGESFFDRSLSLDQFLKLEDKSAYNGKISLVGEMVSGGRATDIEPIPLQSQFAMVGLHANIIDNIIKRDFLIRSPGWLNLLLQGIIAFILVFIYYSQPFNRALRFTLLFIIVLTFLQYYAFQTLGVVLETGRPLIGIFVAVIGFFSYLIVVKDRDRRLVRDVFLKSVSPKVGEEILKNYEDTAIWGDRKIITVLFVDIRGYTSMTESQPPEVVLDLLDKFYDSASEAVFKYDGQVNKFMGDAVLALFGALPEEEENHGVRAIGAAVELQKLIMQWSESKELQELGLKFETGTGIYTGPATVGLVGRRRIRIEYTALGDAVNIASRLQSAADQGEIIIGGETINDAGGSAASIFSEIGLELLPAEAVKLKGKKKPLAVYRGRVKDSS